MEICWSLQSTALGKDHRLLHQCHCYWLDPRATLTSRFFLQIKQCPCVTETCIIKKNWLFGSPTIEQEILLYCWAMLAIAASSVAAWNGPRDCWTAAIYKAVISSSLTLFDSHPCLENKMAMQTRSPACLKNSNASQSLELQMACLIYFTVLVESKWHCNLSANAFACLFARFECDCLESGTANGLFNSLQRACGVKVKLGFRHSILTVETLSLTK